MINKKAYTKNVKDFKSHINNFLYKRSPLLGDKTRLLYKLESAHYWISKEYRKEYNKRLVIISNIFNDNAVNTYYIEESNKELIISNIRDILNKRVENEEYFIYTYKILTIAGNSELASINEGMQLWVQEFIKNFDFKDKNENEWKTWHEGLEANAKEFYRESYKSISKLTTKEVIKLFRKYIIFDDSLVTSYAFDMFDKRINLMHSLNHKIMLDYYHNYCTNFTKISSEKDKEILKLVNDTMNDVPKKVLKLHNAHVIYTVVSFLLLPNRLYTFNKIRGNNKGKAFDNIAHKSDFYKYFEEYVIFLTQVDDPKLLHPLLNVRNNGVLEYDFLQYSIWPNHFNTFIEHTFLLHKWNILSSNTDVKKDSSYKPDLFKLIDTLYFNASFKESIKSKDIFGKQEAMLKKRNQCIQKYTTSIDNIITHFGKDFTESILDYLKEQTHSNKKNYRRDLWRIVYKYILKSSNPIFDLSDRGNLYENKKLFKHDFTITIQQEGSTAATPLKIKFKYLYTMLRPYFKIKEGDKNGDDQLYTNKFYINMHLFTENLIIYLITGVSTLKYMVECKERFVEGFTMNQNNWCDVNYHLSGFEQQQLLSEFKSNLVRYLNQFLFDLLYTLEQLHLMSSKEFVKFFEKNLLHQVNKEIFKQAFSPESASIFPSSFHVICLKLNKQVNLVTNKKPSRDLEPLWNHQISTMYMPPAPKHIAAAINSKNNSKLYDAFSNTSIALKFKEHVLPNIVNDYKTLNIGLASVFMSHLQANCYHNYELDMNNLRKRVLDSNSTLKNLEIYKQKLIGVIVDDVTYKTTTEKSDVMYETCSKFYLTFDQFVTKYRVLEDFQDFCKRLHNLTSDKSFKENYYNPISNSYNLNRLHELSLFVSIMNKVVYNNLSNFIQSKPHFNFADSNKNLINGVYDSIITSPMNNPVCRNFKWNYLYIQDSRGRVMTKGLLNPQTSIIPRIILVPENLLHLSNEVSRYDNIKEFAVNNEIFKISWYRDLLLNTPTSALKSIFTSNVQPVLVQTYDYSSHNILMLVTIAKPRGYKNLIENLVYKKKKIMDLFKYSFMETFILNCDNLVEYVAYKHYLLPDKKRVVTTKCFPVNLSKIMTFLLNSDGTVDTDSLKRPLLSKFYGASSTNCYNITDIPNWKELITSDIPCIIVTKLVYKNKKVRYLINYNILLGFIFENIFDTFCNKLPVLKEVTSYRNNYPSAYSIINFVLANSPIFSKSSFKRNRTKFYLNIAKNSLFTTILIENKPTFVDILHSYDSHLCCEVACNLHSNKINVLSTQFDSFATVYQNGEINSLINIIEEVTQNFADNSQVLQEFIYKYINIMVIHKVLQYNSTEKGWRRLGSYNKINRVFMSTEKDNNFLDFLLLTNTTFYTNIIKICKVNRFASVNELISVLNNHINFSLFSYEDLSYELSIHTRFIDNFINVFNKTYLDIEQKEVDLRKFLLNNNVDYHYLYNKIKSLHPVNESVTSKQEKVLWILIGLFILIHSKVILHVCSTPYINHTKEEDLNLLSLLKRKPDTISWQYLMFVIFNSESIEAIAEKDFRNIIGVVHNNEFLNNVIPHILYHLTQIKNLKNSINGSRLSNFEKSTTKTKYSNVHESEFDTSEHIISYKDLYRDEKIWSWLSKLKSDKETVVVHDDLSIVITQDSLEVSESTFKDLFNDVIK